MAKLVNLSSGCSPASTFPNAHLFKRSVTPPAQWVPPQAICPMDELRRAVKDEDWAENHAASLTKIHMQAEWCATPERCTMLETLVSTSGARTVLEIGSFCGVGTLALAQSLPEDGQVLAIELDEFVVNFGKRFVAASNTGHKITNVVGPALESLKDLAAKARAGKMQPFDMVVVDADKACMEEYFRMLWSSPGLLADNAVVCVDLTPYKGQPPLRYLKYGFPYQYEAESGQKEIDSLRSFVAKSPELAGHEFGGMLTVQMKRS
jgi:caffeoyl-CoA O-methyltransferase